MTQKVILAIFDNDLKARTVKKFDISDSGDKIKVKSGGEAHFMPQFDNDSFIEFPRPWYLGGGWKRVYFVKKGAKACVNFETEHVPLPDPEQVKKSVGSTLLDELGKEKPAFPVWIIYLILLLMLATTAKVFGVIV